MQLSCCPNINLKKLSIYAKYNQAAKAKRNQTRTLPNCGISQNGCQSNNPLQLANTDQQKDQIEEIAV